MYTKERTSKTITLTQDQINRINSKNNSNSNSSRNKTNSKSNNSKSNKQQQQSDEGQNIFDCNEIEVLEKHTMDLPLTLHDRLFDHQKYGVDWLYRAFKEKTGGILGDDMGLGKTFQVCCLLCGLLRDRAIGKVLIVSPVSVIPSWFREINEHVTSHVENLSVELITSEISKTKRLRILK